MPATDAHQHLWPEPLLRLLAARAGAPRLRRTGDGWELELTGEAPETFDLRAHDPAARTALARTIGVDRLVLGSDRPVADPPALAALGPAVRHAIAHVNPARILDA